MERAKVRGWRGGDVLRSRGGKLGERGKSLNVSTSCCGRCEQRVQRNAHGPHVLPATHLVSFALHITAPHCSRLKSRLWRLCVAQRCDDAAQLACVPLSAKPVPINLQDTPAAIPHFAPEERMRRLVCRPARDKT